MRNAVLINHLAEPGFYESANPDNPRFIVFPQNDFGVAAALQLDASRLRPAFSLVELGAMSIGLGRWVCGLQITVGKEDEVDPAEGWLGTVVVRPYGLGIVAKDGCGRLGTVCIEVPRRLMRQIRLKKGSGYKWRIVDGPCDRVDGTDRVLFESHPASIEPASRAPKRQRKRGSKKNR